ncbi:MAG: Protein kinase domain-containing protein [Candidatus Nitrotoga sp. SPKER]|nr:MAG: Protein kinase domain-containing protein [Candidatus Nitrotoga sp. SPKER]
MSTPSSLLCGHVINGWYVKEPVPTFKGQTGGVFSNGYIVTKDNKQAFLKALDLHDALKTGIKKVEETTRQFNFERELNNLCRDKRLSHIVTLIDDGEYQVDQLPTGINAEFNTVYYLIFELADGGDIRREISFDGDKTDSWKCFVLHQVAVALTQLHKNDIAHQDLKPSNVLSFKTDKKYKLSDLGRSNSKHHLAPTDIYAFPGDLSYAPPEYYYHHIPSDHQDRRYGSDAYLLGSMISFLFCGIGAINLTFSQLPQQYKNETWEGNYEELLPFLIDAHSKATKSLAPYLPYQYKEEMALMYFHLCHPNPQIRGHPTTRSQIGRKLGLDRYISRLDAIAKRLIIQDRNRSYVSDI